MRCETKRLILREFSEEDADDLQEILGDAGTMEYCEPPYAPDKTARFLREFCIGRHGALAAELRETGRVIGYLLFNPSEAGCYEMGWFFRRDCWRRGYAYEACSALIEYAFTRLGAHKVWAETIDGVKSVGLMKKLGMASEGVRRAQTKDLQGRWADLYFYGLLKEDFVTK